MFATQRHEKSWSLFNALEGRKLSQIKVKRLFTPGPPGDVLATRFSGRATHRLERAKWGDALRQKCFRPAGVSESCLADAAVPEFSRHEASASVARQLKQRRFIAPLATFF